MKSTELVKPSVLAAPLAFGGDRSQLPFDATGTNQASVEEGFPLITSVSKTEGGLPPKRVDLNTMFYLSTDQKAYLQNGGIITFEQEVSDTIGGYPKGAILDYVVGSDFIKVRSLIEDNTYNFYEDPSFIDGEKWEFLDFGGSGVGAGAPIGSIFPTFCSDTYIPNNCLPCNGSEYSLEQFGLFYTNYLVSGKLLTCSYDEYAASIETYGKCAKFAIDATVGTFKTPYLPNGSFIQQSMTDTELGMAYNAGLPSALFSEAGGHTHTGNTNNDGAHIHNITLGRYAGNSASNNSGWGADNGVGSPATATNTTNNGGGTHNHAFTTNLSGVHTHTLNTSVLEESNTVQPEAIALRWFVVVGTGAISEADMDWSEWATSLNGRANIDLSNLSVTGEKHFLNKAQISNCLLEVPQRIKYTLEDGTLTLKAGSIVIVPYGTEDLTETYPISSTFLNDNYKVVDTQFADGKFFLWVELVNDFIQQSEPIANLAERLGILNFSVNVMSFYNPSISSNSAPTIQNGNVYRTDLNLVQAIRNGVVQDHVYSLPILTAKSDSNNITASITQVWNGFGYIGSVFWADKGIKVLMPNGRNSDGTCNNIEYTTTQLKMLTSNCGDNTWTLAIDAEGNLIESFSSYTYIQSSSPIPDTGLGHVFWYNPVTNETTDLIHGVPHKKPMVLLPNLYETVASSNNIYKVNSTAFTVFKAVDYKELPLQAANAFVPSNKSIDLTLGASGSTYTMPAPGWLQGACLGAMGNTFFELVSYGASATASYTGGWARCSIPVKQGQKITIYYGGTNFKCELFRFTYAEGAQ